MQRQRALVVRGIPAQRVGAPKKKKNKNKKKNKAGSNPSLPNSRAVGFAVSHGGMDYIQCVLSPRDGPMAHVPWGYPIRSRLVRTKCTGIFTSGASGCPFVSVNPWRMIASDWNPVQYSNSSYVSPSSTVLTNSLAGVIGGNSNSDYTLADLTANPTMNFRLVSAGLYASATSSLTTRAGTLFAFTEPDHASIVGLAGVSGQSLDSIQSYEGCHCQATPMDNREVHCIWGTPEQPSEAEFASYSDMKNQQDVLNTYTGSTSTTSAEFVSSDPAFAMLYHYNMIIACPDASQTTFRFECYAVFEISGKTVTGKSGGNSDPNAFSAISGYLQSSPGKHDQKGTVGDVASWAMKQSGVMDGKGNVQWATVGNYAAAAGKAIATLL